MGTALIGSVLIATLSTRGVDRRGGQPGGQRCGEGADLHRTGRRRAVHLRRAARRPRWPAAGVSQAEIDAITEINADGPARGPAGGVRAGRFGRHRRAVHHRAGSRPNPPGDVRTPRRSGRRPPRRPAGLSDAGRRRTPGRQRSRRRASSSRRRRTDPARRRRHRDPGGPGQHRQQLQVDDLGQVVGQRRQPQRQVDQRLRAGPPARPGSRRSSGAARGARDQVGGVGVGQRHGPVGPVVEQLGGHAADTERHQRPERRVGADPEDRRHLAAVPRRPRPARTATARRPRTGRRRPACS